MQNLSRAILAPTLLLSCFVARDAAAKDAAIGAGASQRALVVRVEGDAISARACEKAAGCDPAAGGLTLRLPAAARANVERVTVDDLTVKGDKHVALVRAPGDGDRELVVIVASTSKTGDSPAVLYSGWSRRSELEVGRDDGGATLTLKSRSQLCGRDVLVRERSLDASKLAMTEAPGPDPIGGQRAGATKVRATVGTAKPGLPILSARGSSSGKASAVVDGDAKTAWTEDEPGSGARSWVSFASPADVPITGLDLRVGAAPADVGAPRAPRAVTIVTDGGVFAVELPEDAGARGGADFAVPFTAPIRTRCVAVVVDDVYPAPKSAKKGADPAAYLSELVARTALDGATLDEIAMKLAGQGPDKAKAELAVLSASGDAGIAAITAAYPKLDGPGRDAARRVIDSAGCDAKLALYVPLLAEHDATEVDRARDRIRRCGKIAGPKLIEAMRAAVGPSKDVYAEEAALVAPDDAIPVLIAMLAPLGPADSDARRAVRHALAKAALRGAGIHAFDAALSDASFGGAPLVARVDTLRAMGESLPKSKAASAAFAAAALEAKAFRDRYLLLAPAGELARAGDAFAARFLGAALSDGDLRLRARAASVGGGLPALHGAVVAAVDDKEVRVRRAALEALSAGQKLDPAAAASVLGRLEKDGWSFVRLAAAGALRFAPLGDPVDARLGAAIDFEAAPLVRTEMVRTLGERGARAQAPVVTSRMTDAKEALDVRVAAVNALGAMCDGGSVDALSELAQKGRAPFYEADRKLAVAAILALARLAPTDLDARLAPLRGAEVPGDIRDMVKVALSKRGGCSGAPAASRGP
jgi:hypothetical protein